VKSARDIAELREALGPQIESGNEMLKKYCGSIARDSRGKLKVEAVLSNFSEAVNGRLKHLDQVVRDLLQMVSDSQYPYALQVSPTTTLTDK